MKRYCKECHCYHPEIDWLYHDGLCRIADMWWESVQDVDREDAWFWEMYEEILDWKAKIRGRVRIPSPVENVRRCGCKTYDWREQHGTCFECQRRDQQDVA